MTLFIDDVNLLPGSKNEEKMGANSTKKPGAGDLIEPYGELAASGDRRHLARLVLTAFLITFTLLRIIIFQIMDHRVPDMFVYIKGTHVHHLNFGIFLLAALGAYLLFGPPKGRHSGWAAVLYGIGLALTFDEFGMWLHLAGGYWQRANFDAVTVVAGFLTLMAFGPEIKEFRGKHAFAIAILLLLGAVFFVLLLQTVHKYGGKVKPRQERPGLTQSQGETAPVTACQTIRKRSGQRGKEPAGSFFDGGEPPVLKISTIK